MQSSERHWLVQAVEITRQGIAAGQMPFGAVIVRDGQVVAQAHNTVWLDIDPTAHAEVNAIRRASHALASIDLSGCVMYTTCEPCPMCLAAIHWSRIDRVVYGATIADAAAAGFSELRLPAARLAAEGGSRLIVEHDDTCPDCRALFNEWKAADINPAY